MHVSRKNKHQSLTFEEALRRLEQLVNDLESGDLSLEKTLRCYEEGVSLLQYCRKALAEVEQRIKILEENANGNPQATLISLEKDSQDIHSCSKPQTHIPSSPDTNETSNEDLQQPCETDQEFQL